MATSETPQPPAAATATAPAPAPVPTDFKLFKPRTNQQTISLGILASLPEVDLTPTSAELKAAQATLSARSQALVNAPLLTRAAREAEAKVRRERYPEARIRIKFVDQTILEKVFPSGNKIRAVYAFVRSCLREDVKPVKFVLYEAPKRELKVSDPTVRDLTLFDLQLAPSCVLLVRFEDPSLNHVSVPAPLSPEVLAQAVDFPTPPPEVEEESEPSNSKPKAAPKVVPSQSSSSASGEKKIPKWLKLGKK